MEDSSNILICGYPRSGTTWIGKAVAASSKGVYFHEPDNEKFNWSGFIHKKGLHRYPYSNDPSEIVKVFEETLRGQHIAQKWNWSRYLFQILGYSFKKREILIQEKCLKNNPTQISFLEKGAFACLKWYSPKKNSYDPVKDNLIVKSVHSGLTLDKIVEQTGLRPLIVFRNPAAILSSQLRNEMNDLERNVFNQKDLRESLPEICKKYDALETPLEKGAAQIGLHHALWQKWIGTFGWPHVKHEDLVSNQKEEFEKICQKLDLPYYEDDYEIFVNENSGTGDTYSTARTVEQLEQWKTELTEKQIVEIRRGYNVTSNLPYSL